MENNKKSSNPSIVLKTPTLSLFIAKRNSGKSHLAAYLLYMMAKTNSFDYVLVVSPTDFTGFWSSKIGPEHVQQEFNELWLLALLEHQKKLVEKKKPRSRCLLILDDCLAAVNFQSNIFTRLATAGRHYNLTVWAMFQHMHKIPTVMRSNSDYIFLLNNLSDKVAKAIFEEYQSEKFQNWRDLLEWSKTALQNHGVMLIDNTGPDALINRIRAPSILPSYKLKMKL